MAQFLGFSNSADGAITLSGTEAPIDSTAATSGANLAATNAGFAQNQMILIHQSQGPSVGGWEVNQINSYTAGTITPSVPLANTYSLSSGNAHQVRVLSQYSTVLVTATFTCKAWNGTVGGLTGWIAQYTNITGTVTANACGFRAGTGAASRAGGQAEGSAGPGGTVSTASNGNGGGGGDGGGPFANFGGGGGGGGGNATAGSNGASGGTRSGGIGGTLSGTSDLTIMVFGGGGGGGGSFNNSSVGGTGGVGGGIIFIISTTFINSGSVTANGSVGGVGDGLGDDGGGAGGGGGNIFIKSNSSTLGTGLQAVGAIGGAGRNSGGVGATGSNGRIRIETCVLVDIATYMTTPTAAAQIGGLTWCSVYSQIF